MPKDVIEDWLAALVVLVRVTPRTTFVASKAVTSNVALALTLKGAGLPSLSEPPCARVQLIVKSLLILLIVIACTAPEGKRMKATRARNTEERCFTYSPY